MYYVYAINSIEQKYIYVGLTNNPIRRFNEHQRGKEKTTRTFAPFEIVYLKDFLTRQDARDKEKYLKSGCGKEHLKNLINDSQHRAQVAELVDALA